ncbi:MAG TPA: RNA polymerase sigma factor [Pirellulales bacterium]|jgi:RNA polymerase sigma-70 factor (ECF subfamily)|nr:RNA polymerase sigma factor [Pirellulales bacterium]
MSSAIKAKRANDAATPRWSEMTDEQLLLAYRREAAAGAFETLVRRYERELFSYLFRYLGDAAMAEDAFQATFLQVHLKREQFEEGRKVRPWLYTIATNQSIDAQRRNKRHRILSLDRRGSSQESEETGSLVELLQSREPEASSNLEREERREWIREAVQNLPEPLRGAVALVYYQGIKYREAAEILGIPVGTVKSRLNAALHRLSEAWNQTRSLEK